MNVMGIDADSKQYTVVILHDEKYQSSFQEVSKMKTAQERFRDLCPRFYGQAVAFFPNENLTKVFIEEPLFIQSPHATISTSFIIAVIAFALLECNIPYELIRVGTWKRIALGYGRADKQQIEQFVKQREGEQFCLPQYQHLYDAYCIALAGSKLLKGGC